VTDGLGTSGHFPVIPIQISNSSLALLRRENNPWIVSNTWKYSKDSLDLENKNQIQVSRALILQDLGQFL